MLTGKCQFSLGRRKKGGGDAKGLFFRRCVYNTICISPLDTHAAAAFLRRWGTINEISEES